VGGAGDVDGDGLADVLLGAPYATNGEAWLYAGSSSRATLATLAATLEGEARGDEAGESVAGGGDVDGDGYDDVLVGAPGADTTVASCGKSYLLLGPLSGTIGLADADGIYFGEGAYDEAGRTGALGGDLDGDGRAEIVVGTDLFEGGSDRGAAYVMFGGEGL
jgi:hypothetical protein